jgi:hypothetical protein
MAELREGPVLVSINGCTCRCANKRNVVGALKGQPSGVHEEEGPILLLPVRSMPSTSPIT